MKKGIFCISIDTELLWGRKHLEDLENFIPRVRKERYIIEKLLRLFSKYEVAATWAIVGKLFLPPSKDEKDSELWYGHDITDKIRQTPGQEIGCHTFSHPFFSEISRGEAEEEIKKSLEIAKKNKVRMASFIFPKNEIKYLGLVKKYGFYAFRGDDLRSDELLYPASPPVYTPKLNHKLVNIQGSLYFVSARGIRRFIPYGVRLLKCKMGINRAIKEKKVFHLWFHPIDFSDNTNNLLKVLEEILKYASLKRDNGRLEIKTMKDIAREALN